MYFSLSLCFKESDKTLDLHLVKADLKYSYDYARRQKSQYRQYLEQLKLIWVVVKIRVPFWVPEIIGAVSY